MRTQVEIVEHLKKHEGNFLDFTAEVLVPYLTVDQARPFLREDADLSLWTATPLNETVCLAEMREYMEFAWGKVEDHRGLSAVRSVQKMSAWLWLLGDDALFMFAEDDGNYKNYGAPILKAISDKYGFPIPESDGLANMAQGRPCRPGCNDGCAR